MKESGGALQRFSLFAHKNNTETQTPAEENQEKPKGALAKIWDILRVICLVLYRVRGIFMAVPVIYAALWLAAYNSEHLPLLVGINLQTTGEFARIISRQTAVTFPLFITGACLALTLLSRKNLYPWLISVFSLAIPVLLLVTNMYPA